MRFTIPGFQGQVNLLAPERIEDSQAEQALNAWVQSGNLDALKEAKPIDWLGVASGSLYKHPSRWVAWGGTHVNVARAPAANDLKKRFYYSYDGVFRVSDEDFLSGGLGTPTGSRRVGLPQPTLDTPNFEQAGLAQIASVRFIAAFSLANRFNALVTTTTAHTFKKGDWVLVDMAGFEPQAYEVEIPAGMAPTQFRLKHVRPKLARWSVLRKPATVDSAKQPIRVKASGHGFSSGDSVALHWKNSVAAGNTGVVKDQIYEIEVLDPNQFVLVGTEEIGTPNTGFTEGGGRKVVVQVQASSNPWYAPTIAWVGNSYQITVGPDPDDATEEDPTAGRTVTRTDIASAMRARAYVATYVNFYGEEGPPSLPTKVQNMTPGTAVHFSTLPKLSAELAGPTEYWIAAIRLYRTDQEGNWRLCPAGYQNEDQGDYDVPISWDIPYAATQFTDVSRDYQLGEVLPSVGWWEPPSDLKGVILAPGGVLVGFKDKTVYASRPYMASAWPLAHQVRVDHDIVGLAATAAGVVILTVGNPYLLIGADPASWSVVKLESPQACISARSIVDMGDYALYASPDGLAAIQGNNPEILTRNVLSRAQWQAYDPSNLVGGFYEGRYVGWGGGYNGKGFIFHPETGVFTEIDQPIGGAYNDLVDDTLYIIDTQGRLAAFDRGDNYLTYTWVSKLFQMPAPCNFGAAQVLCAATSERLVQFELWGDGALKYSQAVASNEPFRLPGGYRCLRYQVKLRGTAAVRAVVVGSTIDELKGL